MAFRWIGVGIRYPLAFTPCRTSGRSPSASKLPCRGPFFHAGFVSVAFRCVYASAASAASAGPAPRRPRRPRPASSTPGNRPPPSPSILPPPTRRAFLSRPVWPAAAAGRRALRPELYFWVQQFFFCGSGLGEPSLSLWVGMGEGVRRASGGGGPEFTVSGVPG